MSGRTSLVLAAVVVGAILVGKSARGADWPQWRYDAARSAISPQPLPEGLHLCWVREYPALKPAYWQVRQGRVQFDLGYEPVVVGKTLFVGSSRTDSLTALDTNTGTEQWRFYADGPVRLAPAVAGGRVYFASDDGCLYCLDSAGGKLLWKRRGAPSLRKLLGNGRLISAWPARGGPVVDRGRVYFAAGVWPFEGIFVYALDAATGEVVWLNDRCGSLYLQHPHGAMSFGGPAPQGYLLVHEGNLVVPSSRAFPAFFDLATGKLVGFDFGHGGHGSRPGSWFLATDADGRLVVDPDVNYEIHDAGRQVIGQQGIRRLPDEVLQQEVTVGGESYRVTEGTCQTISAAGKPYRFADVPEGISGPVHTMLAADGKLFVVTRAGSICCFGPEPAEVISGARFHRARHVENVPHDQYATVIDSPVPAPSPDRYHAEAKRILKRTGASSGYGLVWGLGTGRLVEEFARQSQLHLVVVDPDAKKIDAFRRRCDEAGLYGHRIAAHAGDPLNFGFPPYMASLIVSEDPESAGLASGRDFAKKVFRSLRPYGGAACFNLPPETHDKLAAACREADIAGAELKREEDLSLLLRRGPLPGAADYVGTQNCDERVKSPLGLLWFGDTFHHHKLFYKTFYHEIGRGLPTNVRIVDGVMKYLTAKEPYGPNPPGLSYHLYLRLLETTKSYAEGYTDVYTGRVLSPAEVDEVEFPPVDAAEAAARGEQDVLPLERKSPLTGVVEARHFVKNYGCDRSAVDYGHLLTMRSGTAAFYDKRSESGTVNVSGIRSGCRNSIVPGCGVLCLPSWTGNCTCNYPVYTSMALVNMPEAYEQWSAWDGVAVEAPIERVGLNFGAPGDRVTAGGTLWLDCPSAGGPSPQVPVRIEPPGAESYYRHSLWIRGGQGWPWVNASGVKGVESITIEPVAKRSDPAGEVFGVRWTGSLEPEVSETYTFFARSDHGVRLFIAGQRLIDNEKDLRRGEPGEVSAEMKLEAGVRYPVRIEYYGPRQREEGRPGTIELAWSSPSVARSVIPSERLFTADRRPGGLTGAYYDGGFSGPAVLRVDTEVRFDWGRDLPDPLQAAAGCAKPHPAYTVYLYFAEPEDLQPGRRMFSVAIQGREVLSDFDVVAAAGGPMRGVEKRFDGVPVEKDLTISFTPKTGRPLVCGLKLVAESAGGKRQ